MEEGWTAEEVLDRFAEVYFAFASSHLVAILLQQYLLIIGFRSNTTRMWANAQPDGRPAEHRWRPLFNAAKFS